MKANNFSRGHSMMALQMESLAFRRLPNEGRWEGEWGGGSRPSRLFQHICTNQSELAKFAARVLPNFTGESSRSQRIGSAQRAVSRGQQSLSTSAARGDYQPEYQPRCG